MISDSSPCLPKSPLLPLSCLLLLGLAHIRSLQVLAPVLLVNVQRKKLVSKF